MKRREFIVGLGGAAVADGGLGRDLFIGAEFAGREIMHRRMSGLDLL